MRRARGAASALLARRDRAARQPRGGPIGYSGRSCRWCPPGRRLCAHSGTPVLVPDTWSLSPPDEDQNTCDRRLPLVWRRWIHAATDTLVRRLHGNLPGDRLARLDLLAALARRRLAEEAPGRTAPKLRGAHARDSGQCVLMRRHTWRTPDVAGPPRPVVRNAGPSRHGAVVQIF